MKIKFRLLLQISLLLFSISSFSQNVAPASTHWNLKKGLALEGYDPVSYFQGDPEEGSKDIAASFNGATYYFVSKKNQSLFTENPQKFVPEYGGWCAYAMGNDGNKVKVDPETFKVVDGTLYLFYNFFFNNTLEDWNEDEGNIKPKADNNWKKWLGKNSN